VNANRLLPLLGLVLVTSGCEKRVPVPSGATRGTPHVGWVIMVGDRDNPDREFVCQSDPRTDCVLPASRPDNQAFTDVHLYFHPASKETRYAGTVQIGFFEGATPHELKPNVTVKPGAPVARSSVAGIVSSTPGTRALTIAIVADSGTPQQIQELVPVRVQ
jgi:hypothetical protein